MIERVDADNYNFLKERLEEAYNDLFLFMENEVKPESLSATLKLDYDKFTTLAKAAGNAAHDIAKIRKIK